MSSTPKTQVTVSAVQALILQDVLKESLASRYTELHNEFQERWKQDAEDYIKNAAKSRFFGLIKGKVYTLDDVTQTHLPKRLREVPADEFGPDAWYVGWRGFWDSASFKRTSRFFCSEVPSEEVYREIERFANAKFVDGRGGEIMESVTFNFDVYRLIIRLQEGKASPTPSSSTVEVGKSWSR